jgi:hypothetical protein
MEFEVVVLGSVNFLHNNAFHGLRRGWQRARQQGVLDHPSVPWLMLG